SLAADLEHFGSGRESIEEYADRHQPILAEACPGELGSASAAGSVPPSPGGGGSRARRAGWGDLSCKPAHRTPALRFRSASPPPLQGRVRRDRPCGRCRFIRSRPALVTFPAATTRALLACRSVIRERPARGCGGYSATSLPTAMRRRAAGTRG